MEIVQKLVTTLESVRLWIWILLSIVILILLYTTKKRWGSASKLFFFGAVVLVLGWVISLYPVYHLSQEIRWIPYAVMLMLTLRYYLKLRKGLPGHQYRIVPQLIWFLVLLACTIAGG